MLSSKVDVALANFSNLSFDSAGDLSKSIDGQDFKITNLTTDTQLDKSAANVKSVLDGIKIINYPINISNNALTRLPPLTLASRQKLMVWDLKLILNHNRYVLYCVNFPVNANVIELKRAA